jgi:signal transduction histidine kinase
MEELKYVVEDSTIIELLGLQNFSTSESAVLELVKNAYDARALHLCLTFNNDTLIINDDGIGMDDENIREHWMHIGKSDKDYQVIDENNNIRILAGSKGVGRFALSRLGHNVVMSSKKEDCCAVTWKTDWNSAIVEKTEDIFTRGTTIRIEGLREKWSRKRIDNLCKFLELTYKDTSMEISVSFEGKERIIPLHFKSAKPGLNCKSCITLNFKNGVIVTSVDSDEFTDEASQYCEGIDIHHFESSVNVFVELRNADIAEIIGDELQQKIIELGDFSAKLYFNIVSTAAEMEKFLYKHKDTPEVIDGGVILYRNAFSISSYEGKKDWLGFGKRSRKSPAPATHPTGAWRVRENQVAGYVDIDKKRNSVLQDLSNRQGLYENEYYQLFIEILIIGIAEFERYRQSIIRKINLKNKDDEEKKTPVLDKIMKRPTAVKQLSNEEAKQLAMEIKDTKKGEKESRKIKEETEARYKYDVRILNVLATTGLKASSIAHEMKNDMSMLNSWYSLTIEALKSYGMWDELNTSENTKLAFRNVPELLSNTDESTKKISLFMATMLEDIEKRQFETKIQEVLPLISTIKKTWERDYAWIDITINVDGNIEHLISEDVLQVILDNLILNTVQQNDKRNHVSIIIKVRKTMGLLRFDYYDDGIGLDKKYENNPMKILEVHETTRRDGHGLGMWIIHNTCVMSGGDVLSIDGDEGFHISFTIGGNM